MSREPKWEREELILALDLLFTINQPNFKNKHAAIIELSLFLQKLPIHQSEHITPKFRNDNAIYLKHSNFLRFDSEYNGKGMSNGSKLDKKIWDEFNTDREKLKKTAAAIRNAYHYLINNKPESTEIEKEFEEGKILTRLHLLRERNHIIVKKKKELELRKSGRLKCEVCGFDFMKTYGKLGKNFIECHHIKPVSEFDGEYKVKISDLALVCANCHRMLHKARPWLSIADLKKAIKNHQY